MRAKVHLSSLKQSRMSKKSRAVGMTKRLRSLLYRLNSTLPQWQLNQLSSHPWLKSSRNRVITIRSKRNRKVTWQVLKTDKSRLLAHWLMNWWIQPVWFKRGVKCVQWLEKSSVDKSESLCRQCSFSSLLNIIRRSTWLMSIHLRCNSVI